MGFFLMVQELLAIFPLGTNIASDVSDDAKYFNSPENIRDCFLEDCHHA